MKKILKNGKELIIRQPVREDAVGLIEHMLTVDSETRFLGREPNEFNFTLEQEEVFIAAQLKNTKQCFLVGEMDNEVVANISVSYVRGYRRFLHRATMGITIQKKCWGMGIGKVLMQKAIEWCKENNIEQLELEVVSTNTRAIALYESFGFKTYGTIKNALKYEDGAYADEYQMVLFL